MTTRYLTHNSVYEVREHNRTIRRVSSSHEPTPRQGEDGQWRTYEEITEVPQDGSILIRWPGVNADGSLPCTITSPVVGAEVVDDE